MLQREINLLDKFVDRNIVVVVKGVEIADEQGSLPMVCEGILLDFDDRYIMIGDSSKTIFSLISHHSIVKIDIIDEASMLMMDPTRPEPESMN
jgi:hypothetical protein